MNPAYTIQFAEPQDIDSWMRLVRLVQGNFPGLETEDQLESYHQTLLKNIQRGTALCARQAAQVVGGLLFSPRQNCLSWMAVHPDYRRQGIGVALVAKMLSLFPPNTEIWVTTFRDGDPKAPAPRALYKKFGFVEAEWVEEFNYPLQKLVLRKE